MSSILSSLFDFRSKEEKARNYEAYSKKIFPYGDAQKDAISEILAALFPNERKSYLVMYYVLIKQGVTEEEPMDFESAVAKAKKYKLLRFTSKLKAGIQSLLNVDLTIDENLQYPSIEELQASASSILSSEQNNE